MKLSIRLRGIQQPATDDGKGRMTAKNSVFFEPGSLEELSIFFRANKDKYSDIWIVLTKKKQADPQPVSFDQAVSEAIRQGLVDSRTKSLDERKYAIRFTKRRIKGS